jgi:hypothetical protein
LALQNRNFGQNRLRLTSPVPLAFIQVATKSRIHAQQGISNQYVTRLYAKDMVREEQAITVRERDPPTDLTARFAHTTYWIV